MQGSLPPGGKYPANLQEPTLSLPAPYLLQMLRRIWTSESLVLLFLIGWGGEEEGSRKWWLVGEHGCSWLGRMGVQRAGGGAPGGGAAAGGVAAADQTAPGS